MAEVAGARAEDAGVAEALREGAERAALLEVGAVSREPEAELELEVVLLTDWRVSIRRAVAAPAELAEGV